MSTLLLKQTEENRPKKKGWELFLGLQLNSNRIHKMPLFQLQNY
jgi:hypothetical protein